MDNRHSQHSKSPIFNSGKYRREAFKVCAILLSYPESFTFQILDDVRTWATGLMPAAENFVEAVDALTKIGEAALQCTYVNTFDFTSETSLFLTSHEHGDSPERGAALIQLLRLLARGGFVPANTELVDAAPVLLEYLSVKPADVDTTDLEMRLAVLCGYLAQHLGDGHAYKKVFRAIRDVLPEVSQEQIDNLRSARASSDREEEMPYPIFYDTEMVNGVNGTQNLGMKLEGSLNQIGLLSEMMD